MPYPYATSPIRNEMIGPEPLSSASPGDELMCRPPVLRAINGCIRQLDWTDMTAEAAGLFLPELQTARKILMKLSAEFFHIDGRFWAPMWHAGLIDEKGFMPGHTPVPNPVVARILASHKA